MTKAEGNSMSSKELTLINLETAECVKVEEDEFCFPIEQFTQGKEGFVVADNLEVNEWVIALQKVLQNQEESKLEVIFKVTDEDGGFHGTFDNLVNAQDQAQEMADETKKNMFIQKKTTELVDCIIPNFDEE